jgi:riboflavin kinase/FMN adenylyltransferase
VKLYRNLSEFTPLNNAIVTTGTFDGVHIGHQKVLSQLKSVAQKYNGESVVLTFFPHPRMVLYPEESNIKLINTIEERIELLEKQGIDHLIVHPFSYEFSRISSLEFVRNILINRVGTKKLVIGYDHRFGRNREGSFEHLKEYGPVYGFDVEEIPALEVQQINVSSTKIRHSLEIGEIIAANHFLGRPFFITGKVEQGNKIGRQIGFPTANIFIQESYKLIPEQGVYAIKAKVNNQFYDGMLNIGVRPTVDNGKKSIEVHLFDFKEDIYNQSIRVYFFHRIRDEEKFESLEALKNQLELDKQTAQRLLVLEDNSLLL